MTMTMEESKLTIICGLKVKDVVLVEGDTGISFENGTSLALYNKYELMGFSSTDSGLLIGKIVIDAEESANSITIRFENNLAIRIDMRDEAYLGPEAMQLCVPGEPIVIWN